MRSTSWKSILTFNINARQLMSSIASTRIISGCSTLIKIVIFLFGSVSATGTTSAAGKNNAKTHKSLLLNRKCWINGGMWWDAYVWPQHCLLMVLAQRLVCHHPAQWRTERFSLRIPKTESNRNLTLWGWQMFHLVSFAQQYQPLNLMIAMSVRHHLGCHSMIQALFSSWI